MKDFHVRAYLLLTVLTTYCESTSVLWAFSDHCQLMIAGRVCVPIDHENIEDFDPFSVPTIRLHIRGCFQRWYFWCHVLSVCHHDVFRVLAKFVKSSTQLRRTKMKNNGRKVETNVLHSMRHVHIFTVIFFIDYRLTSLNKYMDVFDKFVRRLENSRRGTHGSIEGKAM